MSRYYVTIGLGENEPRTYRTDDLELALSYQKNWDEFTEILDSQTGLINCGGCTPPTVIVKPLPKLWWNKDLEGWVKDPAS